MQLHKLSCSSDSLRLRVRLQDRPLAPAIVASANDGASERYCLTFVSEPDVPCSRSFQATVMVLPSTDTVMCSVLITLPSRLSISSTVRSSMRLIDTLVWPGSPLKGESVPSTGAAKDCP